MVRWADYERGIGNGISFDYYCWYRCRYSFRIARLLALTSHRIIYAYGQSIVIGALLLIYIVVYFESAQRKVPALCKTPVGGVMKGSNTHMPFAEYGRRHSSYFCVKYYFVSIHVVAGLVLMIPVVCCIKLLVCLGKLYIFYLQWQLFSSAILYSLGFSPKEMAENLKKAVLLPGIRPGKKTSQYLETGCIAPHFVWCIIYYNYLFNSNFDNSFECSFYLGGTSYWF